MRKSSLRGLAGLLILAGLGLPGCEAGESGAECGPGTVLRDGQCVVADMPDASGGDTGNPTDTASVECGDGTVLQDGKCIPATDPTECGEGTVLQDGRCIPATDPTECGEGTILQDGRCVIDEDAATKLLKPQVEEVKVTRLLVQDEGVRPVYPMHPLTASITLDVDTIDAFESSVILGLESDDGARRCVVGYWPLRMTEPAPEDALTATAQTITLTETFYVQPGCDVLAGEDGVVAWVAFDPFDHTSLAGRVITVEDGQSLTDFLQQARLPLDDCTAPDTGHPDTCVTALEVAASPGRDVVMKSATLSSTVAVLEVLDAVPLAGDTQITDDEGNVIDLGPVQPARPYATTPHFIVNADLQVHGLDGTEADKVEDAALSLNYAIRPLLDPEDRTDLPEAALDWQPLFAEVQEEPKAGEDPVILQLEEEFLKSMVGAQDLVRTSPIFITGNAELFMTRGIWAGFEQFELRVCAAADFDERGIAADPTANNCSVSVVVVVRRATRADTIEDNPGAADYSYGIYVGQTYGNKDKIAVKFSLNGETISGDIGVAAGGTLGAYLQGWFAMTLFEAKRYGWDYYARSKADEIRSTVTVFGFKLIDSSAGFPVGETEYTPISYTKASPEAVAAFSVLGLFTVSVKAWAEGTVGVRASLGREVTSATGTNPKCTDSAAVTSGNYCAKAFNVFKTRQEAIEACQADSGWLAAPASLVHRTAIRDAARKANFTNFWYWVDGEAPGGVSCTAEYASRLQACDAVKAMLTQIHPDHATQAYNTCKGELDGWMAVCRQHWTNKALWTWKGPLKGNLELANATWHVYQPDDAGAGQRFLAQNDNRGVADFADNSRMPYVCQYPLNFTEGGKVWGSIGPFATLTLLGSAGIDVSGFGGELWVAVDLVDASLPATVATQWMVGTPLLTLSTGKLEFVLKGLSGELGGTAYAFGGGLSYSFTFYDWDGIDYARWTVGTRAPRWFAH